MTIIDGKAIADEVQLEIKGTVSTLKGRPPCLAVIIIGSHPPSVIYVDRKRKACCEVGIESLQINLDESVSAEQIIYEIEKLNKDPHVDGILLQLPLPSHINPLAVIEHIAPAKDVDGLHPYNVGKMLAGISPTFFPCTPLGIKEMLIRSGVEVAGKHVVIIGRSNLVGKPMAAILMQNAIGGNATVTVANSKTKNLTSLCSQADIIIAAIGQPLFVKKEMVKEGAVVIDVGINKIAANNKSGYRLVGDVDFDSVKGKCAMISPVPGGVGPMTIAMLLQNTLTSYLNSHQK